MTVKAALNRAQLELKNAGSSAARLESELLLSFTLKMPSLNFYLNPDYVMNPLEESTFMAFVQRRLSGEPIAYIIGEKEFFKYTFKVNKSVLIPRPETELIVEEALDWLLNPETQTFLKTKNPNVLNIFDFGSGSGAIGLSILSEIKNRILNEQTSKNHLYSVDISESALQVSKLNAQLLGVMDSTHFVCCDLNIQDEKWKEIQNEMKSKVDLIVMNPPYIDREDPHVDPNVKKYEPSEALFAGNGGFGSIEIWIKKAKELLRSGGRMYCEIGFQQGQRALHELKSLKGFHDMLVLKDLANLDRVVVATRD